MNYQSLKYNQLNVFVKCPKGEVYTLCKEGRKFIFRRVDNQQFGLSGEYDNIGDAIHDAMFYGCTIVFKQADGTFRVNFLHGFDQLSVAI